MKALGVTALVLFGGFVLPLFFGRGQEPKPKQQSKRAFEIIVECEKQLWKPGKLDDRKKAIDELLEVTGRMRTTADFLAHHGLMDPDDEIRAKSARALANLGPGARRAMDSLIQAMKSDKVPEVRIASALALGAIFFETPMREFEKKSVLALTHALKEDEDTLVRYAACKALGGIGPAASHAAPTLFALMNDKKDATMSTLARNSFTSVVGPDSVAILPAMIEMYKKGIKDYDTEFIMLHAIGKVRANEEVVVPLLLGELRNKDPKRLGLRCAAALGLGGMGPKAKPAVPALVELLEESTKLKFGDPKNMANCVLSALQEIGPGAKDALPAIKKIAADRNIDDRTRGLAEAALEAILGKTKT